jgi:hypothetical protein
MNSFAYLSHLIFLGSTISKRFRFSSNHHNVEPVSQDFTRDFDASRLTIEELNGEFEESEIFWNKSEQRQTLNNLCQNQILSVQDDIYLDSALCLGLGRLSKYEKPGLEEIPVEKYGGLWERSNRDTLD